MAKMKIPQLLAKNSTTSVPQDGGLRHKQSGYYLHQGGYVFVTYLFTLLK